MYIVLYVPLFSGSKYVQDSFYLLFNMTIYDWSERMQSEPADATNLDDFNQHCLASYLYVHGSMYSVSHTCLDVTICNSINNSK